MRVFEWNGPMIHAKSAVADGRWARVGSTNLNVASWVGNWELDVVIEDEGFARLMEAPIRAGPEQGATEIKLQHANRVGPVGGHRPRRLRGGGGSAGRAAMGAVRMGHLLGAVITSRGVLGGAEAQLMARSGLLLVVLAPAGRLLAPALRLALAAFGLWMGPPSWSALPPPRRPPARQALTVRVRPRGTDPHPAPLPRRGRGELAEGLRPRAPFPGFGSQRGAEGRSPSKLGSPALRERGRG